MKISTGLKPTIAPVVHVPTQRVGSTFTVPFGTPSENASFATTSIESLTIWPVSFATVKDTEAAPAGTIVHNLIATSEPKIESKHFVFRVGIERPMPSVEESIEMYSERYDSPEDAIVTTSPLAFLDMVEVKVSWWEVTL